MDLSFLIKDQDIRQISGAKGHRRMRKGAAAGLRKCLAMIERHHKRKEMIRGGARLSSGDKQAAHPDKLTVRTGMLSRSYTRRIVEAELKGYYGSDLVYAPVHEFGSKKKNIPPRPGLQKTLDALGKDIEKIMADQIEKKIERNI